MPTYVYECRTCEKVFEAEQRITEEPLKDCGCGAKGSLRRVIQPVGVVFNGPGFHINDYSSSGKSSSTKAEEKTETKPASDTSPAGGCTPKGCPACSDGSGA